MPGQPYAQLTPPQNSGTAIASLVLGCLGFLTCGLTAIPAVICGHLALSHIGKSAGRLTGSGMAIGGLVTGYLSSLLFVICGVAVLAGMALPVVGAVKDNARQAQAVSQLKSIGAVCRLYAEDNGGKFPAKLEDLVPKYLDGKILINPLAEPGGDRSFQYFGGSTADPADKILAATALLRHKRCLLHVDGSAEIKREPAAAP